MTPTSSNIIDRLVCVEPLLEKRKKIVTGEEDAPPVTEEGAEPPADAGAAEEKPAQEQKVGVCMNDSYTSS
jgi:hypothetical protein